MTTAHATPARCPHCDRPLAEGSPLGICPACLLAAGLPSQAEGSPSNDTPPPAPAEIAAEFPQLEILELIGRGGMGAVYKARQRDLDRLVALKILRPGLDADPGFSERFTREARALAQLNHPGIVTLYEFGKTSAGRYFILMEFVDGVNLRQLLAAGRLAPREALAIVPPLCDALQYAHDRGLIHRDIKPENILVDRLGRVKIADFGLALLASEGRDGPPGRPSENPAPDLTLAGQVMGTPRYMSPEQRERPTEVDHRADLYALGVVFYQMLTGELPDEKLLRPPSSHVKIDVRLDEIVLRALERSPELRYHAASEFKTAVETVASSPPPLLPKKTPRRPFIAAGVYAALVLFGLIWMLASNPKDEFRGLIAIAVTLPWNGILMLVLAGVFKIQLGTMATAVPIVLASGALNTFLIFRLFGGNRRRSPGNAGAMPVKARVETVAQPTPVRRLNLSPWHGFLLLVAAFAALLALTAHELPVRMASHFDETGRANGWMERTPYLLFIGTLPCFIAALFAASAWSLKKLPVRLINLPHRDHWLAPERRAATAASFGRWMAGPACLLVVFFAELHLTTLLANRLIPPRLESGLLLGPTIGFLSALMVWMVGLVLRFSDPAAASSKLHRQGFAITLAAALALVLPSIPLVSRVVSDKGPKLENSGPATSDIVTPRFHFGRIREITLPRARPVAYDFDRERFVDYKPTPQSPHGIETSVQWHAGNGTDVFADPGSRLPGVLFLGTDLAEVNPKLWDSTADEAAHQSGTPDRGIMAFVAAPAAGQPGPTRVYRTPQGGAFLVQLLGAADNGDVRLRYKAILPAPLPDDRHSLRFDRAGDTMQAIVQRLRRDHGLRLAFENLDFTTADAVTLGARLRQLEAKALLQDAEVRQLREARRLRDQEKLGDGTLIDLGARYTGSIDGNTVAQFLDRLTAGTPYVARKVDATWIIQPRAGSVLAFPVTLKTTGLTVNEAIQAILAQSPGAKPIGTGMVFAMPVAPGTDPTPWLSVRAPARDFERTPAAEALSRLTSSALPASVWELAGYRDARMLSLAPAPADEALPVINSAQTWLVKVDRGDYAPSWDDASAAFRTAITKQNWIASLSQVRTPLGETKSRRLSSAAFAQKLPGAPDGRHLVMQFSTRFTALADAVETVTFSLEPDGSWRASGYFIKPAAATFDPVVEHTWTPSGSRFTGLLDLDTGHEFALAQLYVNQGPSMELVDVGTRQVVGKINLEDNKLGWLAEHKIDLLGTREKMSGVLVGIGLTVVPVSPADWSYLSAEDISNAAGLAIPSAPPPAETTLDGANTWLFLTREGSRGILQIVERTENPRALRFRYKRVRPSASPKESDSVTAHASPSLTAPPQAASPQTRLLDLRLELAYARAQYGARHPKLVALEAELSALEAHTPPLRDETYRALAADRRTLLLAEKASLSARYTSSHPKMTSLQSQLDALDSILVSLPAAPINISVLGAVTRPGAYSVRADATLLDALAAAGGWTPTANRSKVSILPPSTGITPAPPADHDVSAILKGQAPNPSLPDHATISIPERIF
ncbi:MAG: DUF4019 domain-containing protein [Opitutaceae bacterium]|jgi:serine/threonine protein kinase